MKPNLNLNLNLYKLFRIPPPLEEFRERRRVTPPFSPKKQREKIVKKISYIKGVAKVPVHNFFQELQKLELISKEEKVDYFSKNKIKFKDVKSKIITSTNEEKKSRNTSKNNSIYFKFNTMSPMNNSLINSNNNNNNLSKLRSNSVEDTIKLIPLGSKVDKQNSVSEINCNYNDYKNNQPLVPILLKPNKNNLINLKRSYKSLLNLNKNKDEVIKTNKPQISTDNKNLNNNTNRNTRNYNKKSDNSILTMKIVDESDIYNTFHEIENKITFIATATNQNFSNTLSNKQNAFLTPKKHKLSFDIGKCLNPSQFPSTNRNSILKTQKNVPSCKLFIKK
jgi:hypothetical protein